ncbi:MAG: hypothetical protein CMM01_07100 [Rhodopirellula sp.]|nr:hypothetical protein [Rhodopirellula sp.]OUX51796.1 MAG: hypothetical protein CBE43_02460 [Rhodopirellula sp. TMED283]
MKKFASSYKRIALFTDKIASKVGFMLQISTRSATRIKHLLQQRTMATTKIASVACHPERREILTSWPQSRDRTTGI